MYRSLIQYLSIVVRVSYYIIIGYNFNQILLSNWFWWYILEEPNNILIDRFNIFETCFFHRNLYFKVSFVSSRLFFFVKRQHSWHLQSKLERHSGVKRYVIEICTWAALFVKHQIQHLIFIFRTIYEKSRWNKRNFEI